MSIITLQEIHENEHDLCVHIQGTDITKDDAIAFSGCGSYAMQDGVLLPGKLLHSYVHIVPREYQPEILRKHLGHIIVDVNGEWLVGEIYGRRLDFAQVYVKSISVSIEYAWKTLTDMLINERHIVYR